MCGDQVERSSECGAGHPLTAMALPDVAAGDAPVRETGQPLLILSPALDAGDLIGWPELAPPDASIAFEYEGGVGGPGANSVELLLPVGFGGVEVSAFLRVEAHAPAAPEDATVVLRQLRKYVPCGRVERLDRVPGHDQGLAALEELLDPGDQTLDEDGEPTDLAGLDLGRLFDRCGR